MATTKTRNGRTWTESRFNSFVKGGLRSISQRWPPKYTVLNEAKTEKKINPKSGRIAQHFLCAKCLKDFPQKEVEVNHIIPVVPISGFDDWNGVIERMFCEKELLEVLCRLCHKGVTTEENNNRKINDKE